MPTGYVLDAGGHWVKDPDRQVQERLEYVLALFRQSGVARQVLLKLKAEHLQWPVRIWGGPRPWAAPLDAAELPCARPAAA